MYGIEGDTNFICPPGGEIRMIATARKIPREKVLWAQRRLESAGFVVSFGAHLFDELHQFAGTDQARASDLQTAIDDPDVKAIWVVRGGYGTIRLLPYLKMDRWTGNRKLILGYSDITVLHMLALQQQWPSMHATMPVNFPDNTFECLEATFRMLQGAREPLSWPHHPFNSPGTATGTLVGGNLSMLYSMTGTPLLNLPEDAILFIEDLDEYLYHIDRMMRNLLLAGVLGQIRGLIIGGMDDMNDNEIPFGWDAMETIRDIMAAFDIPVAFRAPVGHRNHNMPLLMNGKIRLTVDGDKSEIQYVVEKGREG